MSEDCLYLNVYTKSLPQNIEAPSLPPKRPVLVFFEGKN